jgi:hypothetical protein
VTTATLADVIDAHPLPHVHVFKVDVEGAEYDVLRGVDWKRFEPELICIETEHMRKDWHPLLRRAGYAQVFHDGLNAYLLSAAARHRAEHFNYAEAILNGPTIVTPVEAAELQAAADLRIDVVAVRHEVATSQLETERLRLTIAERDAAVAELSSTVRDLSSAVAERDTAVAELDTAAVELTSALTAEIDLRTMYAQRHADVAARLATTETYLGEILGSTSWRVTYPLRRSIEILRTRLPRRLLVRLWRRFRARPQPVQSTADSQEPLMSPDTSEVLARMQELE